MATLSRTNMALAVPPDKQYEVTANVYDDSALLQLADVRQMTSAVQDVITAGAFTFPAGMSNVAEAGAKPTADGTLGSYQLVAQKMAVFVVVTDELLAESAIDIISFYQDAITQQMAKLIDVHGLTGGGPFGTENLAAAATAAGGAHVQAFTGTTAAPTGVVAAFTNAMNSIEADDLVPTGFLSARPVKGLFRSLTDSAGRPLLMESYTADVPDQLYGEPIYWQGRGVFPTGIGALRAIVGDFSQYIIGIRDELSFSLHNEGTIRMIPGDATSDVNLLQQNLTALRAEMRLGSKVIDNKAFARVNNPAT
jgi:HK97 family phage major capsid protein